MQSCREVDQNSVPSRTTCMSIESHDSRLVSVVSRKAQSVATRCNPNISVSFAALLLFLAVFGATSGRAQTAPPPTTAGDTGANNFQSYDGEHETVNLGTGNVMVSVPLLTLPGRNHLDYSVGLVFNSHNWAFSNEVWFNDNLGMVVTRTGAVALIPGPYSLISGTAGQAGAVSCVTPYTLMDENGGQDNLIGREGCTQLEDVLVQGQEILEPEPDPSENTPGWDAVTGVFMDISAAMSNSDPYGCSMDYSNGNRIWLQNCPGGDDGISNPSVLEDANGNYITSGAAGGPGKALGLSVEATSFHRARIPIRWQGASPSINRITPSSTRIQTALRAPLR